MICFSTKLVGFPNLSNHRSVDGCLTGQIVAILLADLFDPSTSGTSGNKNVAECHQKLPSGELT